MEEKEADLSPHSENRSTEARNKMMSSSDDDDSSSFDQIGSVCTGVLSPIPLCDEDVKTGIDEPRLSLDLPTDNTPLKSPSFTSPDASSSTVSDNKSKTTMAAPTPSKSNLNDDDKKKEPSSEFIKAETNLQHQSPIVSPSSTREGPVVHNVFEENHNEQVSSNVTAEETETSDQSAVSSPSTVQNREKEDSNVLQELPQDAEEEVVLEHEEETDHENHGTDVTIEPADASNVLSNQLPSGQEDALQVSESAQFKEETTFETQPDSVVGVEAIRDADRQVLNESATSTGSLREEEIMRTKEQLGATSQAFIERLRGAAFRRKLHLTRSRDSLMAKEQQQRGIIAAARSQRRGSEPILPSARKSEMESSFKPFKAKPIPVAIGPKGSGGLSGVPKVEKKPTTTPFSPLLGARRQLRRLTGRPVDDLKPTDTEATSFRARPLPRYTSELGHAGHVGVPKVPKRPTTIPFSPLLGARRKKDPQQPENRQSNEQKVKRSSGTSQISNSTPALHGLDLLSVGSSVVSQENIPPMQIPVGYQPHSTVRAKKRSEWEAQNSVNQQRRVEQERQERQRRVKALNKELKELRKSL